MKSEKIIQRQEILSSDRKSVEGVWHLIEQFVLPFRGDFYESGNKGETSVNWRKRQIYDATAVDSAEMLSASIHSNLTSLSNRWFDIKFDDPVTSQDTEAKAWLDNAQDLMWRKIIESNFDLKVGEAYLDLVGFGNCFMSLDINEKEQLIFDSLPIKECTFEQSSDGRLLNFYRKTAFTPGQIIEKFGSKDEVVLAKQKTAPNDKMDIIFCVYKKDLGDHTADRSIPMVEEMMPFGYKWVLIQNKSVLKEGSYYDMPFFFVPWRRTSGSVWGNGPATRALSNILTLNEVVEQMLEGAAKAIDPPIFTENRNIIGDVDLSRGGLTMVNDINGIREFVTQARLDVGAKQIDDLRKSIQGSFFVDNLQLKDSPEMSATEANIRYDMIQKMLGPTLGRIQTHLLDPIIERVFFSLLRNDKLGDMPEEAKGADTTVSYVGPLPRAQQFKEAQGIQEFMGIVDQLAAKFPQAKFVLDEAKTLRKLAELKGISGDLLRTEDEVKELTGKEEDAMAMAQQAEIAKTQGQAANQLAQANERGATEV